MVCVSVPSKVSALPWKLLHDRLLTKINLIRRRVVLVDNEQACAFCGNGTETSLHLLLYCDFAMSVWEKTDKTGLDDGLGSGYLGFMAAP
ncbi:hypothetical protein P8452_10705 [Trifolium repens]|nr:hypothetical protein P8452_10705 [Trifolium repens]